MDSRPKVSQWKEASHGGETEAAHIHGAKRTAVHTSGTLGDRRNWKVLRALAARCGGEAGQRQRPSGPTLWTQPRGCVAGQAGSGRCPLVYLWFTTLCFAHGAIAF